MAVTSHVYPLTLIDIGNKLIDLDNDAFRCILFTGDASAWTSTEQSKHFVSDLKTAYTECANADYLAATNSGRIPLTTLTHTRTTNVNTWTCTSPSPISWGAAVTISARSMAIYDFTVGGTDATCPVVVIIDFGLTVASTAGAFTYTVAGTGLATWTES